MFSKRSVSLARSRASSSASVKVLMHACVIYDPYNTCRFLKFKSQTGVTPATVSPFHHMQGIALGPFIEPQRALKSAVTEMLKASAMRPTFRIVGLRFSPWSGAGPSVVHPETGTSMMIVSEWCSSRSKTAEVMVAKSAKTAGMAKTLFFIFCLLLNHEPRREDSVRFAVDSCQIKVISSF